MIAEAAYYLAQRRQFVGEHALEDWLSAEQQVRQVISPVVDSEATMNETTEQNQAGSPAAGSGEKPHRTGTPAQSGQKEGPEKRQGASHFEKFAATQAAGDGIEGEVLKPGKTADEKLGANMPDRK
jgi:Protein of unknown function (DUF2934)